MSSPRSRSSDVLVDDGLRLPRPPGVIRRFWARHPLFADILIALICLIGSFGLSTTPGQPDRVIPPVVSAVLGIVIVSLVSRVMRSTELRTTEVSFDDDAQRFIAEAGEMGPVWLTAGRPYFSLT